VFLKKKYYFVERYKSSGEQSFKDIKNIWFYENMTVIAK